MYMPVLVFLLTLTLSTSANLNVISQESVPSAPLPNGAAVDEVVVESSLYIKPKPKMNLRRTRRNLSSLPEHIRVKRDDDIDALEQGNEQSQAVSNAASNTHYQDQLGFGSAAANAQAQAFNSRGPAASFGASSSGSVTQALNANRRGGLQNSAGASMSQTYTLPNGQTINFGISNSFANAPGNNAHSRGSAVSVSQG